MSRQTRLILSASLLLFVFTTPYIALIQGQDWIITIDPVPPKFTTKPSETIPPGQAIEGYSQFAARTPRIDGQFTSGFDYKGKTVAGEWEDAARIDFHLKITNMQRDSSAYNASLYLKNDFINLYLAIVIEDIAYEDGGELLNVYIDNTYNKKEDAGDDLLQLDGSENEFRDLYMKGTGVADIDSEQNGVGAAQWYWGIFYSQPSYNFPIFTATSVPTSVASKAAQDILIRPTNFPGTWIYEIAHPLNSANNMQDMNAKPGDVIGISLTYWEDFRNGYVGGFPAVDDWSNMLKYTIAGPPVTGGTVDLKIHSIELNQAVQNSTSELPLARRKTTVARVFLDIGTTGPIPANVYLYGTDGTTGTAVSGPLVASVNAPSNSQRTRGVITHSANFLLPTSWIDRNHLKLTAFVTSTTMETNFDNNWLVPRQFTFHKMRVLTVFEIPINTGTPSAPVTVPKSLITQNEQAMRQVFPVEKINFVRLNWKVIGNFTGTFPQVITKLNEFLEQYVMSWLLVYWATGKMPSAPLPDLVYGYYTRNVGGLGGLSDPTWTGDKGYVAVGYIATNEELTMAHECTHNLDRDASGAGTWGRHAGPNPAGTCGAVGPDPNWPYFNDNINEFGLVVTVWPPVLIPDDYPDYMGYCNSSTSVIASNAVQNQYTQWISDYRWEELFEELEQSSLYPATTVMASNKAAGLPDPVYFGEAPGVEYLFKGDEENPIPALQISGLITRDFEGKLNPIFQVNSPNPDFLAMMLEKYPWYEDIFRELVRPGELPPEEGGEGVIQYALVAIDPEGNELQSFYFSGSFLTAEDFEQEQEYFSQHIPKTEGLEPGARIELRVGDRILDAIEVSEGVPEVRLHTPRGGEEWSPGEEMLIEWEAWDPDDDELLFTVQYSSDGGGFWIPLSIRQKERFLTIDPATLPGSGEMGAYIRILATDGFNTGVGQNKDPFFVRDNPPEVTIELPIDGQVFGHGDLIPLKGRGVDREDGELPESALTWEFGGVILGVGNELEVVRLGPGEHIIHLTGVDRAGNEAVAHVRVIITPEEVVPPLLEEPELRAGAGLSVNAILGEPHIPPGVPVPVFVEVVNNGIEPAHEVELRVGLPPEVVLVSESDRMGWDFIEPGQRVGWEFVVASEEEGRFYIGIELESANLPSGVTAVSLHVSREAVEPPFPPETELPPPEEAKTSIEPPIKTEPPESPVETSSPAPTPGFEAIPVFLAIPIFLWFRRRHQRK